MVVVEPCAVRQDEIALHLMEGKRPMRIDFGKLILFLILLQSGYAEAACILVRIFTAVIPSTLEGSRQIGPHQLHRFHHRIDEVEIFRVMPYSVSIPNKCMTHDPLTRSQFIDDRQPSATIK